MYLAGRELLLGRAHIGGQIQISAEHLLARQSFLSDQFQQRSLDVNLHHVLELVDVVACLTGRDQRFYRRKQRPVLREPH